MDRLNPQSPLPLYRQLADTITARIRSGTYTPGMRIPSEHSLSATFGIGRPTVRQAIDLLVQKGLLHRRRGSGTYVEPPKDEVDLFSLTGTTSAFQKRGIGVETRILVPLGMHAVTGGPENPFLHRKAYFCARLSRVAKSPVLLEEIYLHPELFEGIEVFDLTGGSSLSQIVAKHYYLKPTGGRQNFAIAYPDQARARQLEVDQAVPILAVSRSLDFVPARGAVYAELYCRTDQFVFSQTIGGI